MRFRRPRKLKPGDAVVVEDPCVLNGRPGVVISAPRKGLPYVVVLMQTGYDIHLVRADVNVRPWVHGDPWLV